MICPECNGMGETVYYVETARDENTVTMEQRKGICRTCNGSGEKPMTNADRIRSMSDEKLAEIIACPKGLFDRMDCFDDNRDCKHCILEWLKQSAEEDNKNG